MSGRRVYRGVLYMAGDYEDRLMEWLRCFFLGCEMRMVRTNWPMGDKLRYECRRCRRVEWKGGLV